MLLKLFNFSSWFKLVTRRMERRPQELRHNFCIFCVATFHLAVNYDSQALANYYIVERAENFKGRSKYSKMFLLVLLKRIVASCFVSQAAEKVCLWRAFVGPSAPGLGAPRPSPFVAPRTPPSGPARQPLQTCGLPLFHSN